ncbi:MAG: lysylphosphatidylglycerol synthase transmembrane domain-containing protein [Prevotella sp.]|nr:lysylphosphatidylglycerol synthase transmembrane domain-containing protein [Prevotella sp.]
MGTNRYVVRLIKIVLPLILGGAILYWMYRDFDFRRIGYVMAHEMDWTWMLLSFPFGIMAQMFRGIRWSQMLEPLGEHARLSVRINAVFLSYASSLVIPRVGEFARCGVLKRYEGISFSKALGTVVTERAIDTLLMLLIAGVTLLVQLPVFVDFFSQTGTRIDYIFGLFSLTGWIVTAVCGLAVVVLLFFLFKRVFIYNKVKETFLGLWQGIISLRKLKNVVRFVALTFAIWGCYFLHYYLTFFCFGFTSGLGLSCALVTFVLGSIAVIVPTPNGAGPWHFAVKTMLILYGVADEQALFFVLIVHTVQTMLVVTLGMYAWAALSFQKKKKTLNLSTN